MSDACNRSNDSSEADLPSGPVAEGPTLRARPDRRNASARAAVLQQVQSHFREIPGLCATGSQAARLFGLTEEAGARVCDELVDDGVIQKIGSFYGAFRTHFVGAMFGGPGDATDRSDRHVLSSVVHFCRK